MTENKDSNKQPLSPALEYIKKSWKENGFDENEPFDFLKLSKKILEPHNNFIASSNSAPSAFMSNIQKIAMEAEEKRKTERREDVEHRKVVEASLKNIEHSMATLQEINYHLQLNTAQQKEIFDLIVEILAIVKSSNQEEAKGKFEKVTEKIKSLTSLKDSWETVQWLLTMANSAYIAYQSAPHIPLIKP